MEAIIGCSNEAEEGSVRFGLVKTSLVDYPGRVCAVLFVSGCTMRCPYCHNPDFVHGSPPRDGVGAGDVLAFLRKRKSVLGGVCVSGGEPFIFRGLPSLVEEIRAIGLAVKVDTNGSLPGALKTVRPDFIAMDFKTSPEKYRLLVPGNSGSVAEAVQESASYIISSGIPHEFRITAVPGIVDLEDVRIIARLLTGASRLVIAGFRPGQTLDPAFRSVEPYPLSVLYKMKDEAESAGLPCLVRENR
jgi:pyruvate formate lyase activating enzyme